MNKKIGIVAAVSLIAALAACSEPINDGDAACTKDKTQCTSDGVPQKCVDGKWVDQDKCASGFICRDGSCQEESVGKCTTGARQCSSKGIPQICRNSSWMDSEPCADKLKCLSGSCVDESTPVCTNGQKKCSSDGVPQICKNSDWSDGAKCGSDEKCVSGECKDKDAHVCDANDKQCSDLGIPQICKNNDWINKTACSETEICNAGECISNPDGVNCKDGVKQCNKDGVPQRCVEGGWVDEEVCEDNLVCDNGECKSPVKNDLCKDVTCETGKSCINGVCIITAMLKAENKQVCKTAWTGIEYCDENGYKVSCSYTVGGVYKVSVPCSSGCVMSRIPKETGFKDDFFKAQCMSESLVKTSARCNDDKSVKSIPYCVESGTDVSISSSYYCAETILGDIDRVLVDLSKYGSYSVCPGECNGDNTACVPECTSNAECKDNAQGTSCFLDAGVCGCDADDDCPDDSYECASGNRCVKKETTGSCSVAECTAQKDEYQGNACIEGYEEGTRRCGCDTSLDCNDGYMCNNIVGVCVEAADICSYRDYVLCDGNDLVDCFGGIENSRIACANQSDSKYRGNACIPEYSQCGCVDDSDCKGNYTCDKNYGYCKDSGTFVGDAYVESFSDHDDEAEQNSSGYTQTSYESPVTSIKWTSDGFTWRLRNNKVDYAIDKGGVMLKSGGVFSGKLNNGATGVSVKVGQGSSSDKDKVVQIYLNDMECGSVNVRGKTGSEYEVLKCNASAAGAVEIKIQAPGFAIVLDDITWTDHDE